MNRAGLLIIGAVVVAAAALGVIFFTDFLKTGTRGSVSQVPNTPTTSSASPEAQLVGLMNQIQSTGGHSAMFTDGQIRQWAIADGHKLERLALDGDVVMARFSSSVAKDRPFVTWPELGLSWTLPQQFANASNGRAIEIGIVARAAQNNPSPAFAAVYATKQAGNSEWRVFKLSSEFSVQKFNYRVPEIAEGYKAPPVLVLHADTEGQGRAVELLGAYIKLLPQ